MDKLLFSIFFAVNLAFVSALAAAKDKPAAPIEKAAKPLHLLILGGTGFTGPDQVKYALARGHNVTVFNRGKTHPGVLPAEVEQLVGDRSTGDLDALKGRKWDVVIDNPTMLPKWVHAAAEVLQGNVDRYILSRRSRSTATSRSLARTRPRRPRNTLAPIR